MMAHQLPGSLLRKAAAALLALATCEVASAATSNLLQREAASSDEQESGGGDVIHLMRAMSGEIFDAVPCTSSEGMTVAAVLEAYAQAHPESLLRPVSLTPGEGLPQPTDIARKGATLSVVVVAVGLGPDVLTVPKTALDSLDQDLSFASFAPGNVLDTAAPAESRAYVGQLESLFAGLQHQGRNRSLREWLHDDFYLRTKQHLFRRADQGTRGNPRQHRPDMLEQGADLQNAAASEWNIFHIRANRASAAEAGQVVKLYLAPADNLQVTRNPAGTLETMDAATVLRKSEQYGRNVDRSPLPFSWQPVYLQMRLYYGSENEHDNNYKLMAVEMEMVQPARGKYDFGWQSETLRELRV